MPWSRWTHALVEIDMSWAGWTHALVEMDTPRSRPTHALVEIDMPWAGRTRPGRDTRPGLDAQTPWSRWTHALVEMDTDPKMQTHASSLVHRWKSALRKAMCSGWTPVTTTAVKWPSSASSAMRPCRNRSSSLVMWEESPGWKGQIPNSVQMRHFEL